MTNADKIRSMTDGQLALFCARVQRDVLVQATKVFQRIAEMISPTVEVPAPPSEQEFFAEWLEWMNGEANE